MELQDIKIEIEPFWDWFSDNESKIKSIILGESHEDKRLLTEALDNYILRLGLFSWEIGPSTDKPFFFTISPNGNVDLLEISYDIIAAAPLLPDWKLDYCKPNNPTETTLQIYDEEMNLHHIDSSCWNYLLTRTENQKVNLTFEAPNLSLLDKFTQQLAIEKLIINLIGEENQILRIENIEIVAQFDQEDEPYSMPISMLLEHLER